MLLVIVVVLITLGLAIRNPFAGLLGLLMLNIVRPGELYPALYPFHLERVVGGVVLLSAIMNGKKLRFSAPVTKAVLLFWGAMFLSIPLAYWKIKAIGATLEFGSTIVYHLLIAALIVTEQQFQTFLKVFALLNGWLATTSLYLYFTGGFIVRMGIERAVGQTSAGGDPNSLSITLVSGIPIAALLILKGNKTWVRLLGVAVMVLSVVTTITTGSRSGFFALIVLALLFVFATRHRLVLIPIMLMIFAISWILIPDQYRERYATVQHLENDMSYQNRVLAWKASWAMFLSNPITGIGPDCFTDAAGGEFWPGKGRKIYLNAHSLFFKALGELGILGTGAFVLILIRLFKLNGALSRELAESAFAQSAKRFPIACNLSLAILLFTGYSSHNLYRSTWFMLAAMSAALHFVALHSANSASPPQQTHEDPHQFAPTADAL